jgi:hypothetical protein
MIDQLNHVLIGAGADVAVRDQASPRERERHPVTVLRERHVGRRRLDRGRTAMASHTIDVHGRGCQEVTDVRDWVSS